MQINHSDDFRADFVKELPLSLVGSPSCTPPVVPDVVEHPSAPVRVLNRKWIWIAAAAATLAVVAGLFYFAPASEMPIELEPVIAQPVSAPIPTQAPQEVLPAAQPETQPPQGAPASSTESSSEEASESVPAPPADELALSYSYLSPTGERVEITAYAKQEDGQFAFYRPDGVPFTSAIYAGIGSVSQPDLLIFESEDQSATGVITGMRAANGQIYYGVLSLQPPEWIVPCKYEDIYLEDGRYIGDIPQGSSQELQDALIVPPAVEEVSSTEEE